MARLLIHVEGETEEAFVNEVLAPHLYDCGFEGVNVRLLGNARQRHRRGGIQGWEASKKDIIRHLQEDVDRYCSTMVDYYALPQNKVQGWPGRADAERLGFLDKAETVETEILNNVTQAMSGSFNSNRFIPYVMMHEFESLLFSDCESFGRGIGRADLVSDFQSIRDQFASPEEINDSPITAPSKRIAKLVPGYEKPFLGTIASLEIGLEAMRSECSHFRGWLEKLESLVEKEDVGF